MHIKPKSVWFSVGCQVSHLINFWRLDASNRKIIFSSNDNSSLTSPIGLVLVYHHIPISVLI